MKVKGYFLLLCFGCLTTVVEGQNSEIAVAGTAFSVDSLLYSSANSCVSGEIISAPTASITNMLFGRLQGLGVSQSNGEPGYDNASLSIRGVATYNNASIPIYVDGYQINDSFFNYMSAFEIESIRILKDARELAPFGMRGANGIIWVTTKRGHKGKPVVSFEAKSGVQQPVAINKPYGTDDYARLYNEAYSNDKGIWQKYLSDEAVAKLPDVDWYDKVLKCNTPYAESNVSVSGGDDVAQYFVSFGFMEQRGLYDVPVTDTVHNAVISRYNVRANLDVKLSSIMSARVDIGGRIENRKYPNRSADKLWDEMARYPSSIYPVKNPDGTWTGTPVYNYNPLASIEALGCNSTHDRTFQFDFELKQNLDALVKGLYLSEGVALSSWTRDAAGNSRNYSRFYKGVQQTTDNDTPYSRWENSGTNQWNWKHYTLTAGYNRTQGKHSLSASTTALFNIYNTDINQNGNAGAQVVYRHINIGGGVHYSYAKRYCADVTYSLSGSDNYRPGNQFGFYPALSLAWIAIPESVGGAVDFLKLRASVGRNGWDPMGEKRFLWESYYTHTGGINLGNGNPSWASGFTQLYVPNADIFAESSVKYEVGGDAKLLQNRLKMSAGIFLEKRNGIVTQDWTTPSAAGIQNPAYRNIGKVTNGGFDVNLSLSDLCGDFSYNITASASYASNRIDYMAEIITVPTAAVTGNSIGAIFGFEADGFYDISDFGADGTLVPSLPTVTLGNVQPGDVKYRDLNHDNVIDDNDRTCIGNSTLPKLNASLSFELTFRGFDFSMLWQSAFGRDINLLDSPIQTIAFRDNGNVYPIAEGRWAYYPSEGIDTRGSATYPRLSLEENNNNYQNSSLWIRDGSFLKLRNIEVGYTLPHIVSAKLGVERARIYLCGLNLLTISKLMQEYNIDPEVLSGYCAMKSYNIGLSLTF